jgi:hypothetical protein
LRVFFRLDRRLFGEVSRLAYRLIQDFYTACAGRRIQSGAVIAYASAGDFVRFNPHGARSPCTVCSSKEVSTPRGGSCTCLLSM